MARVRAPAGVIAAAAALAMLLVSAAPAAAKGRLVPAGVTLITEQVTIVPGSVRELEVRCPKGQFLIMFHQPTAESTAFQETPVAGLPGLRIVSQVSSDRAVRFTIENSGTPDDTDSFTFFVTGEIECVKERVRFRAMAASFDFDLAGASDVTLPSGQLDVLDVRCGNRAPVGFRFDLADLQFVAEEFVRRAIWDRGGIVFTVGNSADRDQTLSVLPGCLDRSAFNPRSGTRRAAKRPAKPRVIAVTKRHEVDPHPSAEESARLSAKCPKRTGAVSYGWDGNDADGADVFLRDFQLRSRRARVEATNFGADPQAVAVTAICMAMRFRG